MQRFEKKLKRFDKNPRKVYCVDNGIITRNTPTIVEKKGALLENIVAVHLKRLGKEFYYYKGKTGAECDFVLPKEKTTIQICYQLSENNKGREIKGLLEAMDKTKAGKALILTMEQEQEIKKQKNKIVVKPAWQWMFENEASN